MIKYFNILILITSISASYAQIDYTKLIIGRNTGLKYLASGDSTRIFGFAETLGETIDIPGPTIYVNEGDSVKLDFWNVSQGAPHTIHLHGLDVDQQNDGVPSLSFEVGHMDHGYYYFKAPHEGTYLYHCHVVSTIHVQAGMYGVIVVRPSNGDNYLNWTGGENYDREFIMTTSEIDTVWHNDTVLDHQHMPGVPVAVPQIYAPQYFLINGLSDSQLSDPINYFMALQNDKVYLRLSNIGYYGTRYIFPGNVNARTVASDGRPLPSEYLSDTLEIYPGERYETFIQLGSDTAYLVDVEYFNLNTQNIESTQQAIIKTSSLGVNDSNLTQIRITPNPSQNGFFHLNGYNNECYKIIDTRGTEILNSCENVVDLSKEASGLYYLILNNISYKLVKF